MDKSKKEKLRVVKRFSVPKACDLNKVYRFLPRKPDEKYYYERTDRNIGWITKPEQDILKGSVVGIAGCGGMGGLLASVFLRLGVGEVRIADCENFDASNINRQFAAMRGTIGKSKVLETARLLRQISDDTNIVAYPQGISEATVEHFLRGCDVVCDMIEFWAVGARILLHQKAREKNITLINCDTVGHRTFIFRYEKEGGTVEDALGLDFAEATLLQNKIQSRNASSSEVGRVMKAVTRAFVPEIPEYLPLRQAGFPEGGNGAVVLKRLFEEKKASIVATNPPMATGFIANHVMFHLLRNSGSKRNYTKIPLMPGYLAFDAALMRTWEVSEKWWK